MSFAEDLGLFVHDDTPGYATGTHVHGTATATVGGLFDNAFEDALALIAGRAPSILVQDTQITTAARGDAITIAGTAYVIRELQPDGHGLTRLVLGAA